MESDSSCVVIIDEGSDTAIKRAYMRVYTVLLKVIPQGNLIIRHAEFLV